MPLHERDIVAERMTDCVFVGRDLTKPGPKYRFPHDETPLSGCGRKSGG